MNDFVWRMSNRIRTIFGLPIRPRRCCRNEYNRGPVVDAGNGMIYRRCVKCGSRHFEISVDPGVFRVRFL